MNTKSIKKRLLELIGSVPVINTVVSILFFFVWCDIALQILTILPSVGFLIVGFGLPIILLVGIVQYRNSIAYSMVIAIFITCILMNASAIPYYATELWSEINGSALYCSCCPICELQNILVMMIISLSSISLMHHRSMAVVYGTNAVQFYKILIGVICLFVAMEVAWWILII